MLVLNVAKSVKQVLCCVVFVYNSPRELIKSLKYLPKGDSHLNVHGFVCVSDLDML